ncbi:hypothetical protein BB559_002009 [Furculomyces boomerangus]|uniref:Ribosome recycling factor domain-containing protein n=2 Tax=Harpellales TaxID=61421 RepID=A0A2T9YBV4_9FUNG|nr:hypothetical protein BB559_004917 [Furculomyces boomerangus]PVU97514.1 hypothetical protein BB559_002009 [Furculomyces boomerangus]PWA01970.1 hypothetical protein BB558_001907 [Smittium angustum]
MIYSAITRSFQSKTLFKILQTEFKTNSFPNKHLNLCLLNTPKTFDLQTFHIRFYSKGAKDKKKHHLKDDPPVNVKRNDEGILQLVDLDHLSDRMTKTVDHLSRTLAGLRSGRANPAILKSISIVFGENKHLPIEKVASITVKDAQTLLVIPNDDQILPDIEKAIRNSSLGLNPQMQDNILKIPIPKQTKESREKLTKEIASLIEATKVAVRKHRHDGMKQLKANSKEGVSKDDIRSWEKDVNEETEKFIKQIDTIGKQKINEVSNS